MSNEIEKALNKDVDLSKKEYKKKMKEADRSTEKHGVEGKAVLSEKKRHKRMQMNFYGSALNVMVSILAEVSQTNQLLIEIYKELKNNGND